MNLDKPRFTILSGLVVCCVLVAADGIGLISKPSGSIAGSPPVGSSAEVPGAAAVTALAPIDQAMMHGRQTRHLEAVLGAAASRSSGVVVVEGFDGTPGAFGAALDQVGSFGFIVVDASPAFMHSGIEVWMGRAIIVSDLGGVPSGFVAYKRMVAEESFVSLLDEVAMQRAEDHLLTRGRASGWLAAAAIAGDDVDDLLGELEAGPEDDPAIGDVPGDECERLHPGQDCPSLVRRDICRCENDYRVHWDEIWAEYRAGRQGCVDDFDASLQSLGIVLGAQALMCLVDIWIPGAGGAAAAVCIAKSAVLGFVDWRVLEAELADCQEHVHQVFVGRERALVAKLRHCKRMAEARDCGGGEGGGDGEAGDEAQPEAPRHGAKLLGTRPSDFERGSSPS